MIASIVSLLADADIPSEADDPACINPPGPGVEIDIAGGISIQPDPCPAQPPGADGPEPDELAELEQFLAEIREAMEPDSRLEDDITQWKE